MLNYPGPYQLRLYYTCDPGGDGPLDHVLALNLALAGTPEPGTAFADINVIARVVADHPLSTVTDELVAYLRELASLADSTFTHAELWVYEALSFNADFVSTYNINLAGIVVQDGEASAQDIYVFRTWEGNLMKMYTQEFCSTPGPSITYPNLAQVTQDLVDFFIDDNHSFFLARDTSYPLAFLKLHPGSSESIFKARNR
jgi:hypothetical protein